MKVVMASRSLTSGHLWQGRYKSFIVQDNEHLLTVARYIEGNPVRAMLSPSAAQWPWSSHEVGVKNVGSGLHKWNYPVR